MGEVAAVRLAIDLVQVPSRVRHQRSQSLPDGVTTVLRIAAGDGEAEVEASQAVGRPRELVRKAAPFFIEQILLFPDADSYRVLGSDRHATASELRRNMALLLRWLHPDLDPEGNRSIYAGRVTRAWEDLKTPERREAYDSGMREQSRRRRRRKNGASRFQSRGHGPERRFGFRVARPRGILERALSLLFGRTRY